MEDAKIAVQTGVDGLDVVIGTSSYLREHSHGKDMTYIKNAALEASFPDTKWMLRQNGRPVFTETKGLWAQNVPFPLLSEHLRSGIPSLKPY